MKRPGIFSLEFLLILACGIALSTTACASLGRASRLEGRCLECNDDSVKIENARFAYVGLIGITPLLPFIPYFSLPNDEFGYLFLNIKGDSSSCPVIVTKDGARETTLGRSYGAWNSRAYCEYPKVFGSHGDSVVALFGNDRKVIRFKRTADWIYDPIGVPSR